MAYLISKFKLSVEQHLPASGSLSAVADSRHAQSQPHIIGHRSLAAIISGAALCCEVQCTYFVFPLHIPMHTHTHTQAHAHTHAHAHARTQARTRTHTHTHTHTGSVSHDGLKGWVSKLTRTRTRSRANVLEELSLAGQNARHQLTCTGIGGPQKEESSKRQA